MLPDKSHITLNGSWFVFESGSNTIRIYRSWPLGCEKIYYNEKLVSTRRSVRKISQHEFRDFDENLYNIIIKITSYINDKYEITINKNNQHLRTFSTTEEKSRMKTLCLSAMRSSTVPTVEAAPKKKAPDMR